MKSPLASFKYLVAALLCFAAAAVLNVYGTFLHPRNTQNHDKVAANVVTALSKAYRDMSRVKPYLSGDTLKFHELLNDETYYPTFIYKTNQVVFWTDHTLVTDLTAAVASPKVHVTENKFGKYLVSGTTYKAYQIQVYIPLERLYGISNKYLSSGLHHEIFDDQKFKIILDSSLPLPQIKYQGVYLFSLQPPQENSNRYISHTSIAFILAGLILLIGELIRASQLYLQKSQLLRSSLTLLVPLLLIRFVLLYFNFPFSVWDFEIFNPRIFAASFWSPSIGDLALNALLLLIFALHVNQLFRKQKVKSFFINSTGRVKTLLKISCALALFLLLGWLYYMYYTSFSNSLLVMDITQSLQFSVYRVFFYVPFVIHTIVFLVFAHLLMQVFCYLGVNFKKTFWLGSLVLLGLILIISGSITNKMLLVLLGVGLLFYLAVLFNDFSRHISTNPFQNYLFIFWIISVSAITGSLAMSYHYHQQLMGHKKKFADNLLAERDIEGEYLLEDIARKIQRDQILKSKITSPFANKDFIQLKIQKYYLRDYFDKYESAVKLFDGANLASDVMGSQYSISDYRKSYLRNAIQTEHRGLYLIQEGEQPYSRRYIKLIPMEGLAGGKATIALELSLAKIMPYSVVPELLVDQRNFQPLYTRAFSYAIYQGSHLQSSEGNYEYVHSFNRKVLRNPALFENGVRLLGFHHFGVKQGDKRIIISTEQYTLYDVISNFSFLFLVHTLVFFLYMLTFLSMRGGLHKALNTTFSTKIQLFLNFGILIPLLVVSVALASLVTASYKRDLQDTYEKRGKLVQDYILNSWSWPTYNANRDVQPEALSNNADREVLREEVNRIADLSEADIDIYNHQGRLITSSQPLVFEKGLMSRLINPEALADIRENHAQRILLKEKMGNISFNALYLPLPSIHQRGEVDGFIGIPFFDSEKELDLKLIQLLTTVMNIFAGMFLLFMLITNWASRALTVPLKLVTQKLKQTTLTGKNEELVYESADEIGLLVSEYNHMLHKLEDNKKELAIREKEAAWREMARQVAHEIKNPLTPMKLSLQYLQKAIAEKRENLDMLINKISGTLITQIDILSDIATSFSNFTALPDLKPERVNLVDILKQSLDLHNNPGAVCIKTSFEEGAFEVIADENILMRTFNNLIINALQAVPAGRHPEILVSLRQQEQKALISFCDNGAGIPADIQHKVFIPNFSTKFTGSGIGLAVAKKGIESAGGRIWFKTQEGEGTTFYIELPLVQE